jgi:hypothetical protein
LIFEPDWGKYHFKGRNGSGNSDCGLILFTFSILGYAYFIGYACGTSGSSICAETG